MYKGISDDELIYLIREENNEALEYLLKRYHNFIKIWITDFLRNDFLIDNYYEDMYQNAVLVLLKCINNYSSERGVFYSFVRLCVKRELITLMRSDLQFKGAMYGRNNFVSLNQEIKGHEGITYEDLFQATNLLADPQGYSLIKETDEILSSDLLNEKEKKVLNLWFRGDSYREIAEKLGMKPKNVDNILMRIKRKIKKWVIL